MENDALKDLMQAISDDGANEPIKEEGTEPAKERDNEPDYKAMFEAYKSENDNKLNVLMSELEALKNPKKEPSEQERQRVEYLKELGLDGIDEKLKRLEELDQKQREKEEQEALVAKYAQVESELRKAYPDADLKAMGELATKLSGLANGDLESWKTLLNLVNKSSNTKKADDSTSGSNNIKTSDFNEKLKKGEEISPIDLGKELMSLM
ncbi:DUF4460 domain-containing protein [Campylobacter estrildidarum]|uniref:Uncharacterized protein n=1 Tax=Campylobacter estrildidarum TaxID=2510189 RepID=A0A4U7BFR2_9BACT|nr:hypothetical protein [Campylobacter estrildidarum]TKX30498.1 hypothetical protein CQA69_06380 [Campylobacter estrildidarum]